MCGVQRLKFKCIQRVADIFYILITLNNPFRALYLTFLFQARYLVIMMVLRVVRIQMFHAVYKGLVPTSVKGFHLTIFNISINVIYLHYDNDNANATTCVKKDYVSYIMRNMLQLITYLASDRCLQKLSVIISIYLALIYYQRISILF